MNSHFYRGDGRLCIYKSRYAFLIFYFLFLIRDRGNCRISGGFQVSVIPHPSRVSASSRPCVFSLWICRQSIEHR